MPSDFDSRLRSMAEVIVRVGLNLQPGQPLLVTDPYDLLGVHPDAQPLAAAIQAVAGRETLIVKADPAQLRDIAATGDQRRYTSQVAVHTLRLRGNLKRGGAFLFLTGSAPHLFAGLPADRLARFNRVKWRLLGPVIQRLVRGASQWTLAPAPSATWADAAYADLPTGERLPALWQTVLEAMRVDSAVGAAVCRDPADIPSRDKPAPTTDPVAAWQTHLAGLARRRDELNTARHRRIRYVGPGTDLTLDLPRTHTWCTGQLISRAGVPFVANLPTEEVFTAPHKGSAAGILRVARPVVHGGAVIDGIELEFKSGRVVAARARSGQDTLQQLLATDGGACRIGEVAMVPALMEGRSPTGRGPAAPRQARGPELVERRDGPSIWQSSSRLFHHTLLDENAAHHIALGDAYRFCSSALLPLALNHSQVHLDLPLNAAVELS